MMDANKLTLSVPEAAELLGISKSKMYELVHIQGFPVVCLGGRRLINRRMLTEWLDAQTIGIPGDRYVYRQK